MISQKNIRTFRRSLLRWYHRHGRDLPWRHTRNPYAILVSEFMLQQTQVATVIPYYNEWLRRFPDFPALAAAPESDVLHAWQGLGYYNRARNFHAAAKAIVARHGSSLPRCIEQLRSLPGIGKYTAHAIATFAFDQPVPIVEANTARLLSRIFDLQTPIDQSAGRKIIWSRAAQLVPKRGAARFNSALVDLGALVCLPRKPQCGICPVKKFCRAPNPEVLPRKKARPRTKRITENHALIVRRNKILLEQAARRWRGMWVLPPLMRNAAAQFTLDRHATHPRPRAKLDCLKQSSSQSRPIHASVFSFTHDRVTLRVFRQRPRQIDHERQRWFSKRALDSIPIPSPHRRAIVDLLH